MAKKMMRKIAAANAQKQAQEQTASQAANATQNAKYDLSISNEPTVEGVGDPTSDLATLDGVSRKRRATSALSSQLGVNV